MLQNLLCRNNNMGSLSLIMEDSPFTLENIPFGVFSTKDDPTPRTATAIGDFAVNLQALSKAGIFSDGSVTDALSQVCRNRTGRG